MIQDTINSENSALYKYWNVNEDNISRCISLAHTAIISFLGNLSPLLLKRDRFDTKVIIFWTIGYFVDQNSAILPTAYTQVILILI